MKFYSFQLFFYTLSPFGDILGGRGGYFAHGHCHFYKLFNLFRWRILLVSVRLFGCTDAGEFPDAFFNEGKTSVSPSFNPFNALFNVISFCGRGRGGFRLSPCPGFSRLQSISFCLLSICTTFLSAFYLCYYPCVQLNQFGQS